MKRKALSKILVGAGAQAHFPPPRAIDPIVSTEWLAANLDDPDLVIIDIRENADGYIPNSISVPFVVPFSAWITMKDGLILELPEVEDLFDTIGDAGITSDSLVVVVGGASGPFPLVFYALAGTTRVADTLLHAGVRKVAVLDGGYDKWAAEGRAVSTEPVTPTPVTYTGKVDKAMFVSKDYVEKKIGKSIIVDARDADVYFGVTLEADWTSYEGHIPSAKCLPTPWLWTFVEVDGVEVGIYKDTDVLREMASGVVGWHGFFKEIIAYCGVGGYASTTYFVLSEVLGYKNVKIYDGSAQEWTLLGAPVVLYKWE